MPRYAYSPLATDPNNNNRNQNIDISDNFNKKRDICIGFLVLSAIVYVLARAGGAGKCDVIPMVNSDNIQSSNRIAELEAELQTLRTKANSIPTIITSPSNLKSSSSAAANTAPAPASPLDFDIGAYRAKILAQTTPHIIECIEAGEGGSQEACHLPRNKRFASLNQKGVTLWMTGLSGSGKSTIASQLEEQLVLQHGKSVYRLDGDNIRTGLNRDLGFSNADRAESVRRVGELACLFADAGTITIVSLISPYKADRDAVRKRHEDQGLKFLEVFMDVPLNVVQDRDPKGLYEKVAAGQIKHFTGVDDPYEAPERAELVIKNHEMSVEAAVDIIMRKLKEEGCLVGGPSLPLGLPFPDGDELVDLHVPESERKKKEVEAESLPKALLTDIDVNWLQTIGEGWAAPLKGFMREGALLQTIHFNSILVDPYNLTGSKSIYEKPTDFTDFSTIPPKRVSMSVPIVLPCTSYTREAILSSGKSAVALVNKHGKTLGILHNPEIYINRKEEIVSRIFGVIDPGHPYIQHIYSGGDWLIGGEIELLDRIRYNDGLDKWRLTAIEVMREFEAKKADAVFAFQTRNPTHAGHAYLMKTARDILLQKGFKNPILWLSPLGGWTKSDDVPLDVRVKQHEAVLSEGMLDPATTVMAIWPAPMIYAGPTEVLFHAKSRRNAGATYFVAGRDPAGMKGSEQAVAHKNDDLYDGNHGRYVLTMSPGQYPMNIIPFSQVFYDKQDHTMKNKDTSRPNDFIDISGSKMRALAKLGAKPCPLDIPSDLISAKCIPPGFMVPTGWDIVCDYYQNVDSDKWIPYSVQNIDPLTDKSTKAEGVYSTTNYKLQILSANSPISPWHDLPLLASSGGLYNMVVEIPKYSTAKMEMSKEDNLNPIKQDVKDKKPRYYTYGVPFFSYGFLPQTWEDPDFHQGDNDPIDVIEVGSKPLPMGAVVPVRVLGLLKLIDEGETDHKIIAINSNDINFDRIHSMSDLETYYPGIKAKLVDWLINYKTSDGKPQNTLASNEPASSSEAIEIINQVHDFYKDLIAPGSKKNTYGFYLPNSPHSNSYSSSSSYSVDKDTPKSDSISSSSNAARSSNTKSASYGITTV